jgi:hypothetical protein
LRLDRGILFQGPVYDFVDLYIWVSRDTGDNLDLAQLLATRVTNPEITDAGSTMSMSDDCRPMPWIVAVGGSAVLSRAAYELLGGAGDSIGVYRASFLASEHFGVGRHPVEGPYRTEGISLTLLIEAVDRASPE